MDFSGSLKINRDEKRYDVVAISGKSLSISPLRLHVFTRPEERGEGAQRASGEAEEKSRWTTVKKATSATACGSTGTCRSPWTTASRCVATSTGRSPRGNIR